MFSVKRFTGFVLSVSFFMWLQPLGAFIKPSQEESACGGNRAFHMCSTQFAAAIKSAANRSVEQRAHFVSAASAGIEKTNSTSSGAGAQLEMTPKDLVAATAARRSLDLNLVLPAQIFFAPASPVPKI